MESVDKNYALSRGLPFGWLTRSGRAQGEWMAVFITLIALFLVLGAAQCVTAQRAQARALRLIAPFITANNGDEESCLPIVAVWLLLSPQGFHRETTKGFITAAGAGRDRLFLL